MASGSPQPMVATLAGRPPEAGNHLTIEELAADTGLSVSNIRSHQARGLLPPPDVRQRVGYYGDEHAARLRLIRELQDEGLKLEGIKRLLDASAGTGEGLLRVKRATEAGAEAEGSEHTTAAELADRFGLEGEEAASALVDAEALGILVPLGDGLYEVPIPSLLDAAEEAARAGISLARALEVIEGLGRQSRTAAQRFVRLFVREVWEPFAEAGMPESQWPAIAEAMERARPLAAQALLALFRRDLGREIETTFADITRRLAEGRR